MARMGCDIRTDEVAFILLTNKKNNNLFFLFSMFFSNSRSKTLLKSIITCLILKIITSHSNLAVISSLAMTTFKTVKLQIASLSELKTVNLIYFHFSLFSYFSDLGLEFNVILHMTVTNCHTYITQSQVTVIYLYVTERY